VCQTQQFSGWEETSFVFQRIVCGFFSFLRIGWTFYDIYFDCSESLYDLRRGGLH